MYLIFDTETIGLPANFSAPIDDLKNWSTARCVQIGWQLHDKDGALIELGNDIIKPDNFDIPLATSKIHGITNSIAHEKGILINEALDKFTLALAKTKVLIGHNVMFDINVLGSEYFRLNNEISLLDFDIIDTMKSTIEFCALSLGNRDVIKSISPNGQFKDFFKFIIAFDNGDSGILYRKSETLSNFSIGDQVSYSINEKGTIKLKKGFKQPKLSELYYKLFNYNFDNAHNAAADVAATARCFFELLRIQFYNSNNTSISNLELEGFVAHNPDQIQLLNVDIEPTVSNEPKVELSVNNTSTLEDNSIVIAHKNQLDNKSSQSSFFHLRCHTSYSVLQSTISVKKLINKAKECGMKQIAMTDHGNLFGAFEFVSLCNSANIKPILGCEFYLVKDRLMTQGSFTRESRDRRYSQVLYAKNKNGYQNLCKISSYGYIDGLYNGFPRIDKKLIEQYRHDLIATTSGVFGEIAQIFINEGEIKAKECFLWWLDLFGDDFYIELSRNDIENELEINQLLVNWSKEYSVPYLPANRIYYLDQSDSKAHDALLCVKNGEQINTPKGSGHGFRPGLPNDNFYFKSYEQVKSLFVDYPLVFPNLESFGSKFDSYSLQREILLPKYELPNEFASQNKYLRHLCYEGAQLKYNTLSDSILKRIDFELDTIEKTGYPGYFLIVQDIISQARSMDISVGPGRGSVGGSVVAYCLNITTVDPLKYDLLFERFLNPERVSMPDIDIDFDDVGRSKLINWVVGKYGKNQVAQIITYGTMGAKSSIRDMGRVLNIPLPKVDVLAKKLPNISLSDIFSLTQKELSSKLNRDDMSKLKDLTDSIDRDKDDNEIVSLARLTEGSIRNLGTHACGVIITPDDITNYIPVCKSGDSNLLITQFDNNVVERAGMLKMDFLGLKTLSIIKDAVFLIKKRHDLEIDIDNVDLEDLKTFELYQNGETTGTFQFESPGMQKHLRSLKPDHFEDLIAMNALYRPGPLEYIPNFIERKHGREQINYDLPVMEKYLGNTYGITVYQEQVMKLSQELAGFSEGKADVLRKAMGKKKKDILDSLKQEFFDGCAERSHDLNKVEKIWKDWEAFAAYAFNKSHSTCYSYVAFQTAYLKANYPEEYMASVLTHHMNDLSKLSYYMDECKRMGIKVLGPDLNESFINYSVNKSNDIRFGLGAIKGVGSIAAESIINERTSMGSYISFMEFIKRIEARVVNKRVLESLALGGAFDTFKVNRANFFKQDGQQIFIEKIIQFRAKYNKNNQDNAQLGMFDESVLSSMNKEPILSHTESWNKFDLLSKEKSVLGIYVSGHPLDDYAFEVKNLCTHQINDIDSFNKPIIDFSFAGYLTSHTERMSKNNKPYGVFFLEDYSGTKEFRLFGDEYIKFRNYFVSGSLLYFSASIIFKKWNNKLVLKINGITALSDVSDKVMKEIKFRLHISDIDSNLIKSIEEIVKKYPGKHKLKLNIFDSDVALDFQSKKYYVKICHDLVNEMSEHVSRQYVLI